MVSRFSNLKAGASLAGIEIQVVQMSDAKEVKLVVPKGLMVARWVASIGLVLNGAQPLLSTEAKAKPNQVHKIAICNPSAEKCVQTVYSDRWKVRMLPKWIYG